MITKNQMEVTIDDYLYVPKFQGRGEAVSEHASVIMGQTSIKGIIPLSMRAGFVMMVGVPESVPHVSRNLNNVTAIFWFMPP